MNSTAATKKKRGFDPNTFLATIGDGRKILAVPKKQSIFTQGDRADAVFYIQRGKVRLTVVSKTGREATIGILSEGNFFGEGALPVRFFVWDLRQQYRIASFCGSTSRQ